jgi:hypothetical protein
MNTYISLNGTRYYPSSVDVKLDKVGDTHRAANGTLYYYHRANKRSWSLQWKSLIETSISGLRSIGILTAPFTFIDESGTSYTVLVPPGGYSAKLDAGNISHANVFYYDITIELTEV